MKWLIYTLIVLLVIILELSLFRVFGIGSFVPDLVLLLTLAMVWSGNNFDFVFFAVLGGFWMEIILGLPVGSIILSSIIIGGSAYLVLHRWFFSEKPWQYFFVAVIAGTVFLHLWLWIYTQLLFLFHWSPVGVSFGGTWRNILPSILVNLILIYPIYAFLDWLAGIIQNLSRNRLKI